MGVAFLAIYLCISILEFKLVYGNTSENKLSLFMYFYIRI